MKKSLAASSTEEEEVYNNYIHNPNIPEKLSLTKIENDIIESVQEMRGILMDYINLALGARASGRLGSVLRSLGGIRRKITDLQTHILKVIKNTKRNPKEVERNLKAETLNKYCIQIFRYLTDIGRWIKSAEIYDKGSQKFKDSWMSRPQTGFRGNFTYFNKCNECKLPKAHRYEPYCLFCQKETSNDELHIAKVKKEKQIHEEAKKREALERRFEELGQRTNPSFNLDVGSVNKKLIDVNAESMRPFQSFLPGFLAPSCCGIVINTLTDKVEKWDTILLERRIAKLESVSSKLLSEGKIKGGRVLELLKKKLEQGRVEKNRNSEYDGENILSNLKKDLQIPEEVKEKDPFIYYLSPETHNKKGEIKEEDYYNNLVIINPNYDFEREIIDVPSPQPSPLFGLDIRRSVSDSGIPRPRTPLKKRSSWDDFDIDTELTTMLPEGENIRINKKRDRTSSVMSPFLSGPTAPPSTPVYGFLYTDEKLQPFDLQEEVPNTGNELVRRKSVGFRSEPEVFAASRSATPLDSTLKIPTPARPPKSIAYQKAKAAAKKRLKSDRGKKKGGGKKRTRKRRNKKRKKTRKRIYFKDLL